MLGIFGVKIIVMNTLLPAAIVLWFLVAAMLFGTVVGIVSGVLPVRKAVRLDFIDVLR